MELSDRHRKVFEVVVKEYIKKGEPVGSRTVSKILKSRWSPATIRGIMADLEDMGLLYQPHTSAGRVPTEKGFRYYVDNIVKKESKKISERDKKLIVGALEPAEGKTLEELLQKASEVLSAISRYSGIAVSPKPSLMRLKYIEFLRIAERKVLVVIITFSGSIFNRIVALDEDIPQADLDRMGSYLNERFVGYTILEIKEMIFEEMKKEKLEYDKLLKKALEVGDQKVFIKGQFNMLFEPEFSDVQRMKALFKAFEDKSIIIKMLDKAVKSPEPSVILGGDFPLKYLKNIGVVASPYVVDDENIGTIGVVGPIRMDYSKLIPIVDFTAKTLRKVIKSLK